MASPGCLKLFSSARKPTKLISKTRIDELDVGNPTDAINKPMQATNLGSDDALGRAKLIADSKSLQRARPFKRTSGPSNASFGNGNKNLGQAALAVKSEVLERTMLLNAGEMLKQAKSHTRSSESEYAKLCELRNKPMQGGSDADADKPEQAHLDSSKEGSKQTMALDDDSVSKCPKPSASDEELGREKLLTRNGGLRDM